MSTAMATLMAYFSIETARMKCSRLALIAQFHKRLSEDTVRERYFQPFDLESRSTRQCLERICSIGYDRELALVARWSASGDQIEHIAI